MSDAQAVFFEAFDGLDRLGPGSEASTLRALSGVRRIFESKCILDIGCGAGAQTMALVRHTSADIVAVDSHEPFLAALKSRAGETGVGDRVRTIAASMLELGPQLFERPFDVLWAESSIYVIGFDHGLREWRPLLREGGVMAVSEAVWLTNDPSEETRRFWDKEYPAMRSVEANIEAAKAAAYTCVEHFVMPVSDWTDNYYVPLGQRVAALRQKYAGDEGAIGVLDTLQAEIDLYSRAGNEYGYAFYVLRRSD